MQISDEYMEQILSKMFSQKKPEITSPVIVFDSKDNKNLYPSGLINQKDAEKYANWWMDNQ
jgi:hypothetical protein